jgi:hypothetical protein
VKEEQFLRALKQSNNLREYFKSGELSIEDEKIKFSGNLRRVFTKDIVVAEGYEDDIIVNFEKFNTAIVFDAVDTFQLENKSKSIPDAVSVAEGFFSRILNGSYRIDKYTLLGRVIPILSFLPKDEFSAGYESSIKNSIPNIITVIFGKKIQ